MNAIRLTTRYSIYEGRMLRRARSHGAGSLGDDKLRFRKGRRPRHNELSTVSRGSWCEPISAIVDPCITLAAMATATSRIRLGPMVTSLQCPIVRMRAAVRCGCSIMMRCPAGATVTCSAPRALAIRIYKVRQRCVRHPVWAVTTMRRTGGSGQISRSAHSSAVSSG